MTVRERPTIHYSELPPPAPNCAMPMEWEFYRREAGRLIAEGHEGKWVLIKGEEIVGFFDSQREALDVGYGRFPRQHILVHQVRTREPVLIVTPRT